MLAGLGRFRKTDAFAVVGVVMLLVWTPGYVAQDDDAEALADGARFHLPERRVGDVIEYSLVVRVDGEPADMIGPVQRIEMEAARPDETPVPLAYVETRTTYAWNASFGALVFESLPFEDRHFYDADGQVKWRTLRAVTEPSDDHPLRWVEAGVRTPEPYDRFTLGLDEEVRFEPSAAGAMMLKFSRDLVAEFSGPPHADFRMVADKAASFEGRPVYGVLGTQEAAHRVEGAVLADPERLDVVREGRVYLDPRVPHTELRFVDDRPVRGDEKWVWVSPEAPRLVGGHVAVHEVDGPAYTIDLVATKLVRGDGPVVPFPQQSDESAFDVRPALDLPTRDGARKLALSEIDADTSPVYQNASLRDVRAALAESAPPTITDALEDGGRIVGFRMTPAPPVAQVSTPGGPELPLDLFETADGVLVHRSNWTVALLTPEGTVAIASLGLEERPGPDFSARAADACEGLEDQRFYGCDWQPAAPIDWARQTVTPGAIAALARQDWGDLGHLSHYDPLDTCHRAQNSPVGGWGCRLGLFRTLGDGSNMEWSSAGTAARGQATWITPDTVTRYDLGDGHQAAYWSESEPEPDAVRPATASVAAPDTPTLLDVVGTKTAWSGALLVLTTGLFRLAAGLRAGMHVPLLVGLFSRISRADALLNERRADIIELLRADPGLTGQEVAERLGYSRTATLHHLETLMRTGQLLYVQNGQQRHYFPPDGTERERVRVALMRDDAYAHLLRLVDETPGITLAQLTVRLQRSKSRLSRVVARMERMGVLRRERDGRRLQVFPVRA